VSAADPRAPKVYADPSVYALIAANLLAIAIARDAGLRLVDMMAIYWVQSLVIGVSYTVRITSLRKFSADRLNELHEELGPSLKFFVAMGFVIHYGLIHLIYGMIIDTMVGYYRIEGPHAASAWWLCAMVFAVNHTYSLYYNIRLDRLGQPSLYILMCLPYARTIPMHAMAWVFGVAHIGPSTVGWILFALSKTAADVAMHVVEHRALRK
jgi:hypothetical protein